MRPEVSRQPQKGVLHPLLAEGFLRNPMTHCLPEQLLSRPHPQQPVGAGGGDGGGDPDGSRAVQLRPWSGVAAAWRTVSLPVAAAAGGGDLEWRSSPLCLWKQFGYFIYHSIMKVLSSKTMSFFSMVYMSVDFGLDSANAVDSEHLVQTSMNHN